MKARQETSREKKRGKKRNGSAGKDSVSQRDDHPPSAKRATAPCGAGQNTPGGKEPGVPARPRESALNLVTGPHVFSEMHQMATRHGRSHRRLVRTLLFPQGHTAQSSSQPPAAVTFLDVLGLAAANVLEQVCR